jgi:hypothetical protein
MVQDGKEEWNQKFCPRKLHKDDSARYNLSQFRNSGFLCNTSEDVTELMSLADPAFDQCCLSGGHPCVLMTHACKKR